MSDLEPLDPELRELFARERAAYPEDLAARDAVLRRLQAAIVLAPLAIGVTTTTASAATAASAATVASPTTGATTTTAGAKMTGALALGWKTTAIVAAVAFAGGVGAGEAHHALTRAPVVEQAPAAMVERPSTIPAVSVGAAPAPDTLPAIAASSAPTAATSAFGSASPASTASGATTTADVQAERALIDTARAALARGLAEDALSATDAHAKRFPRGRLAEEREALAVQALVSKGDSAAARARAARFRRAFPNSIFRAAVDSAIASLGGN